MRRLILFLVRKRLGLKKGQHFRFTNQRSDAYYFITSKKVWKQDKDGLSWSSVSLNWLLDDDCKIIKEV